VNVAEAESNFFEFVLDRPKQSIYVSDSFRIQRLELDGGNAQELFTFPTFADPIDLALDHLRGQLYFSDGQNDAIYRMNVAGTDFSTIIPPDGMPSNITGIERIKIDLTSDKLYWTDRQSEASLLFRRSNIDGTGVETLFSVTDRVGEFAVDTPNGMLYWGQSTGFRGQGSIRRANFDGTEFETLVSGLWSPNGIQLDLSHGKLYFSDTWASGPVAYDGTIRAADLDGSGANVLINFGPNQLIHADDLTLGPLLIPEPTASGLICSSVVALAVLRQRSSQVRAESAKIGSRLSR
jgi:hypothetical protein